jgi:hypothetical protein
MDTSSARWRKSQHSNPKGACVEIAELPDGSVAVRNSRHPDGAVLIHSRHAFGTFVRGTKDGEFDN